MATMTDTIIIRDLDITLKVNLPNWKGEIAEYEVTWMRNILEEIFEVGFGITTWLVYIKDSVITPLSCTMYFSEEESKALKLGKMLNINCREIMEEIYKRRANEFYAR